MAFTSLDSRLRQVVFKLGGEKHQRFISLYLAWKGVVGELLAERSHPIRIDHNTLFVGVENSAWMQELILLKPKIMKQYKALFHEELQDMVFIIKSKGKKKK
ncbi:MAG: DUF721 domain-containing protein [Candidatus Cloacimonetes bacterium]|nr:DUF721 domain-containing protein [Candidatus Cloacimonadota bacterium]